MKPQALQYFRGALLNAAGSGAALLGLRKVQEVPFLFTGG